MSRVNPNLIGLCGPPRAGKDTLAEYLVRTRGFELTRFSDAIVEEVLKDYRATLQTHASDPLQHGQKVPEQILRVMLTTARTPLIRALLQDHGIARRTRNPHVWINPVVRRIKDAHHQGHPIAVAGVRMPDEVEMIRSRGGKLIKVTRPDHRAPGSGHIVEHSLDRGFVPDLNLTNDGTIADLERKLEEWLQKQEGVK